MVVAVTTVAVSTVDGDAVVVAGTLFGPNILFFHIHTDNNDRRRV